MKSGRNAEKPICRLLHRPCTHRLPHPCFVSPSGTTLFVPGVASYNSVRIPPTSVVQPIHRNRMARAPIPGSLLGFSPMQHKLSRLRRQSEFADAASQYRTRRHYHVPRQSPLTGERFRWKRCFK